MKMKKQMKMGQEFGSKRDRIAETLYASARCGDSVRLAEPHDHKIIIDDDEDDKIIIDDHHDKVHYKEEEENSDSYGTGNRCSSYSYEAQEDLIGEVFRIKDILAANPGDEEYSVAQLYECLTRLESMQLTVKNLKDTQIGRQVNRLRKHSSKEIQSMVKRLNSAWKIVADEWAETTGCTSLDSVSISPASVNNGRNGLPSPPLDEWEDGLNGLPTPPLDEPAFANQMTSSTEISQKSKSPDDTSFKVKLEAAKKRLREGYQKVENAKKQRRVQAIQLQDLPKHGAQQFHATPVPRHHRQWLNKPIW